MATGKRSAGKRLSRLSRQLDQLERERESEAGCCETCSGGHFQRPIPPRAISSPRQ
jgi:hypothetical protein